MNEEYYCNYFGMKMTRKTKLIIRFCIFGIILFILISGIINAVNSATWRYKIPDSLVAEIESACADIGVDPADIINVTYVDTHNNQGFSFEAGGHYVNLHCYKVECSYGFLKYESFQAIAQSLSDTAYPDPSEPVLNLRLNTIRYWRGMDGHKSMMDLWCWNGTGTLQ